MQALIVFLSAIVVCFAATTTHRPHNTHTTGVHSSHAHNTHTTGAHVTNEPSEFETVTFQFNGQTGHLILKVHPDFITANCYVATLSDAEHAQIHTDAGMRAVELRLLAGLSTATMVMDKTTLDQSDVSACGTHNADLYINVPPTNVYTITV